MRDGSGVPFEGSGKPLFTGMFMIFPWETVCHPVDVDAVSHAYSTVALRILVAIANGGSVSEISKNVPEWHFTH